MSQQQTLKDLRSAISLRGSVDGVSPCALQAYQTLTRCGREVRRASLLAWLDWVSGKTIHVTWLLPFSISSVNVDLQESLASRLEMQSRKIIGSTPYLLSCRRKVTPAGLPYFQLLASVQSIRESELSLAQPWATVTARAFRDRGDISRSFYRKDGRMRNDTLYRQMWLHTFGLNGKPTKAQMASLEAYHADMARLVMGFPAEWDACADMVMP